MYHNCIHLQNVLHKCTSPQCAICVIYLHNILQTYTSCTMCYIHVFSAQCSTYVYISTTSSRLTAKIPRWLKSTRPGQCRLSYRWLLSSRYMRRSNTWRKRKTMFTLNHPDQIKMQICIFMLQIIFLFKTFHLHKIFTYFLNWNINH